MKIGCFQGFNSLQNNLEWALVGMAEKILELNNGVDALVEVYGFGIIELFCVMCSPFVKFSVWILKDVVVQLNKNILDRRETQDNALPPEVRVYWQIPNQ
jgi:hypothetical protein